MGWFKIDDGFHCHTKVYAAGTAAVGLYVRCGSWAAQQASDGVVPQAVARQYGTPKMIKALIESGMWHQAGHECKTCPAVVAGTFFIHQYLDRNPSRAELEDDRKAKSERQQRWRDKKKNDEASAPNTPDVDASTDASPLHHGDAAPNPSRPVPSPVSPKGDTEGIGTDRGPLPRIGDRPRIPDASRPLVDKLTAAGLIVGWDLAPAEWFVIEALIKRSGIDALVVSATASWQGAKQQPRSGNYFIPAWRKLADSVPPEQPSLLPAVGGQVHSLPNPGQHRPATSDIRANQAIEAGRRLQALHDAQRAQESS